MKKILLLITAFLISYLAECQVQHITGQTLLVNPTGRTLMMERDNEDSWLTFHDPNDNWYSLGIDRSNGGMFSLNAGGLLNSSQFTMNGFGNVGLGVSNAGDWKLAVNGQIRAKEIKVETGWSDFVFEKDYQLPTLEEVENHINEKGHLKDIPSAKEVAENGIFLGEMDSKLLQKIEELTLYIIAQEKNLNEQNSKLIRQEEEIEQLKLINGKTYRITITT
ncbi:hypothetical protein SAMN04489724_3060 [Algoriphagus locisalis]|uniref:Uncharacterized protein n=1 Tax=Algoriphagus locisalis TaxID=305507 RepID=A0A1I7CCE5_9BACT|nr:hypothetical protein [Algoriphagus locisalis]SFT97083.1 hypothetical protein SAMN04489724_3060 [Algoriphagus locisalis]